MEGKLTNFESGQKMIDLHFMKMHFIKLGTLV